MSDVSKVEEKIAEYDIVALVATFILYNTASGRQVFQPYPSHPNTNTLINRRVSLYCRGV